MTTRELLNELEKVFLAELSKKNSWGKNEVGALFERAKSEALLRALEGSNEAHNRH